jgi:hypothetical protein
VPNDTFAVVGILATPLLAFAGSFTGHLLARKGAKEIDRWRRREETMRMLRWAAERAADDDDRVVLVGVAALRALAESELVQPEDVHLVVEVTNVILAETLDEVQLGDVAETEE